MYLNCGSYSAEHSLHFKDWITPIVDDQHSCVVINKSL